MPMVNASGVGVRHAISRALSTANLTLAEATFTVRSARVKLDARHRVLGAEVLVSVQQPRPVGAWSPEELEGCVNPDGQHPLMVRVPGERPFFLDVLPVTWLRWQRRNDISLPPGVDPLQPRTAVDLDEARSYAASVDKRLPTEAELARAWGGQRFPWGPEPDPMLGRHRAPRFDDLPEVGLHPPSPRGLFDLGAWLWQWTEEGSLFGGPEPGAWPPVGREPVGLRLAVDG